MSAPFADADGPTGWGAGDLTGEMMQDEIVVPGNTLPRGYRDSDNSGSVVTLTTAGTSYAGAVALTITLTETRRIKWLVQMRYQLGSATEGRATIQAAYNSGSSATPGSATTAGAQSHISNNSSNTGINGSRSGQAVGDALLSPGTYTFYALIVRQNGGSSTDGASSFYVLVEDIGSA